MEDSKYYYQLSRSLYLYRKKTNQLLKSRTYALGNSVKIITKEPFKFVGKTARLAIKDPKKLVNLMLGKQTLQRNAEIQQKLQKEYASWIKSTKLTNVEILRQKKHSKQFKKRPLISLITPVFNPPINAHRELIDSVLCQTYANFELLLFDFGNNQQVTDLLLDYAKKDSRVVVKQNLPNKGIGANSNYCLKYVNGEFLGLLDHDDALTPDALYECVKSLNLQDTDFIYTDKDKITEEGQRFDPLFKPDWSPEMAIGGNYMTHFNIMSTDKVKALGGWDPETDGAQDWDLFLRIADTTNKPIVHVPKIVYHWRTVEGSTSNSIGAKPYVINAQQKAVSKHFKRIGVTAKTGHSDQGQPFVEWQPQSTNTLYLINCIYVDFQNTLGLIYNILEKDQSDGKTLFMCILRGIKIPKKENKKIERLQRINDIRIIYFDEGEFVDTALKVIQENHGANIVYLEDSTKFIKNIMNDSSWQTQLTGWLQIPGVEIVGAGVFSDSGQVCDVGSYYDFQINNFVKYHFATGHRSGYNGYIQWTRNFIMPSTKLFAFSRKLVDGLTVKPLSIRDDEFSKLLAIHNRIRGGRAVYEPAVTAIDFAPFEIRIPFSPSLEKLVTVTDFYIEQRDPYYNPNLNSDYRDPKPNNVKYTDNVPYKLDTEVGTI